MQQYLLPIFLYAHVMGAIITFGPAFASPIIARQSGRMPQSGHFAAVLGKVIQSRIMIPRSDRPGHHRRRPDPDHGC